MIRFRAHAPWTAACVLLAAAVPSRAWASAANQSCETAAPVVYPSVTMDSTVDVASSTVTSPCGRGDVAAAWYSFVAPSDGRYVFQSGAGTLNDTTVALYDRCGGPVRSCNDDLLHDLLAESYADLFTGQQIWIRVAGWGRMRGDFSLTVATPKDLGKPENDECADALLLTQDAPISATTLWASGVDSSSCGGEDSTDIWFTFSAPSDGDYNFFLTQNLLSVTLLSVQTGCGTGELACGLANANVHLSAGQQVYLRVGATPDAADIFNVNVVPAPPALVPANDDYFTAMPINSPSVSNGTTRGATLDNLYFGPTCGAYVNAAVWYSFTAPVAGDYVFDTNGSDLEDTVIGVFAECNSGGTLPPQLLGCDDESGLGHQSRVEGFLNQGESICLAVAGHYLSEHADFVLNASLMPSQPSNDRCRSAIPIAVGDKLIGENFGSREEAPLGFPCPQGTFALWYSFTAPEDGLYKFDTKGTSEAQPDIALYEGCGTSTVTLACSYDPFPAVSANMVAGQRVAIRVSDDVYTRGQIVLHVGPLRPDAGVDAGVDTDAGTAVDAGGDEDAAPSADAQADAGPADALILVTADAGSDGGMAAIDAGISAPGMEQDSGCGCSATGRSARAAPDSWLACLLLLALWTTRQRKAEPEQQDGAA